MRVVPLGALPLLLLGLVGVGSAAVGCSGSREDAATSEDGATEGAGYGYGYGRCPSGGYGYGATRCGGR